MKRWYLFMLPLAAVLGPYALPIGTPVGSIFLFRLLVILGFAFLVVVNYRSHWHKNTFKTLTFLLIASWLTYGVASLFWTPDFFNGIEGDLSVLLWLLLVVIFFTMRVAEEGDDTSVYAGWVAAYVLCFALAVWEWDTGHHLHGYYAENVPAYMLHHIAIGTLSNPNNFAATIVLSWPFVFLLSSEGRVSAWSRMARVAVLLSAPILILMADARLALIAFAIQMCVWTVMNTHTPKRAVLIIFAAASLVGASVSWLVRDQRMLTKLTILYELGFSGQRSPHVRLNMFLNGLTMVLKSAGFGVGAGGYEEVMRHGVHYWTNGNPDPHNFWMQIAAEYGLFVLGGFVALFIAMFVKAYENRRWARRCDEDRISRISEMAMLIMVGYSIVCVANSSYMNQSVNWMVLATLVLMVARGGPSVRERGALEGAKGQDNGAVPSEGQEAS